MIIIVILNIMDFISSSASPIHQVYEIRLKRTREILLCVGTSHLMYRLCLSSEKVVTAGVMSPILLGKNCSLGGQLDLSY